MKETKQVIILRKDLNMRKGKMVAQGSHASLAVFTNILDHYSVDNNSYMKGQITSAMSDWLNSSFKKICVSVNSEQELLDLYQDAQEAGLPCSLIRDAGHTEFNEPTYTAVAIGPAYNEELDPLTGKLPLL